MRHRQTEPGVKWLGTFKNFPRAFHMGEDLGAHYQPLLQRPVRPEHWSFLIFQPPLHADTAIDFVELRILAREGRNFAFGAREKGKLEILSLICLDVRLIQPARGRDQQASIVNYVKPKQMAGPANRCPHVARRGPPGLGGPDTGLGNAAIRALRSHQIRRAKAQGSG